MKKLTALAVSAAIVPIFALGSFAFADDGMDGTQSDEYGMEHDDDELRSDDQWDDDLGADEQQDDDLRTGEARDEDLRVDEDQDDDLRADEQQDDDLRADEQQGDDLFADEQGTGERFLSRKPAGAFYSGDVIGKNVKLSGSDDEAGEITDLMIGEDGRILGAVITTGGFLGLGGQEVGVGWDNIDHSMQDDESELSVNMDEEELKNAPELERD